MPAFSKPIVARDRLTKALTWHGTGDIRREEVDNPIIEDGDAIIRVTSCAIHGSDMHLYGGFVPVMHAGDMRDHQTRGEVVEVGKATRKLKDGDRIVVPFTLSCGCDGCAPLVLDALCERCNPKANTGNANRLSDGWII